MEEDSLYNVINELPLSFVNPVLKETDVGKLRKKLHRHFCYNRRAVIEARIAKLTYLCP